MNNHSFDNLVKQKASNHEAPVPSGAWEAIAQKKEKKRRYFIFWWVTGIGILLGAGTWGMYGMRSKQRIAIVSAGPSKMEQDRNKGMVAPASVEPANKENKNAEIAKTSDAVNNVIKEEKVNSSPVAISGQSTTSSVAVQSPAPPVNGVDLAVKAPAIETTVAQQRGFGVTAITKNTHSPIKAIAGVVKEDSDNNKTRAMATGTKATSTIFLADMSASTVNDPQRAETVIAAMNKKRSLEPTPFAVDSLLIARADSIQRRTGLAASATEPVLAIKNKPVHRSSWSIDISATPFLPIQQDQSLLYVSRTTASSTQKAEFKTDQVRVHLQPSMAYMVNVRKKISPRLQIGTGLQYAVIKEKVDLTGKETNTTYTVVQRLVNGGSGPALVPDTVETVTTGTRTIDGLNSYRFVSIPVFVQYTLWKKSSWSLQLNAGMFLNVSSRYHNRIQGELVKVYAHGNQTGQPKNSVVPDLFAGLRFSRRYYRYQFFAEPTLRYNTRRYDLENMINKKFVHQAGLSVGMSWQLGR